MKPLVCSLLCGLLPMGIQAQTSTRPNILLINIDDYGWADMSSNGSVYYETPCIDQLRAEGIWIDEAYAGAANSAPSRAGRCLETSLDSHSEPHLFRGGHPNASACIA